MATRIVWHGELLGLKGSGYLRMLAFCAAGSLQRLVAALRASHVDVTSVETCLPSTKSRYIYATPSC